MFLNLHSISKSRFQKLLDHYQNHGLSVRIHGNSRRLPRNTLPQAIVEDVKNFLSNFADENAFLVPEEFLASKTKTFSYSHQVTRRCEYGTHLKMAVKSQTSKLLVIQRAVETISPKPSRSEANE